MEPVGRIVLKSDRHIPFLKPWSRSFRLPHASFFSFALKESSEEENPKSKKNKQSFTDRISAVIDKLHDRRLPPEARGRSNSIKASLEWRNIVIEQGLEECTELLKEMRCLKKILMVDIKCIDIKIMENEDQDEKPPKEVESAFFSKVKLLKETSKVSVKDPTVVARADSMMIICTNHLEAQDKNLDHISRIMRMWKLQLEQLGVPQQWELIDFLAAHKAWKENGGSFSNA